MPLSPRLLAPAFALLLAGAAAVQGRFDDVEIVPVHVAGKVWCLFGAGGNIAVHVADDGVLVVDSQFLELAPKVEAAIDRLSDAPLRFLVDTHWHGDHTGGNPALGEEAVVVAHENVRRRLAGDPSVEGRRADPAVPGTPRTLPVVTYAGSGLELHVGGEAVRLASAAPAHTDGDTTVWFPGSKVLHTGDVFFQSQYPYVDLDSGGSLRGLLAAVDGILAWLPEDAKVVPGHGEIGDRGDLEAYRAMLADVVARVEAALARGEDAQAMLAGGLLDAHDARWGQGSFMTPERFLDIAAADLAE